MFPTCLTLKKQYKLSRLHDRNAELQIYIYRSPQISSPKERMISVSMSNPKQATRKVISSHQMVVLTSGPQTFQKQAFASSGIRSRFRIGHPIRGSNNCIRKRRIQLPFRRLQARCDNRIKKNSPSYNPPLGCSICCWRNTSVPFDAEQNKPNPDLANQLFSDGNFKESSSADPS